VAVPGTHRPVAALGDQQVLRPEIEMAPTIPFMLSAVLLAASPVNTEDGAMSSAQAFLVAANILGAATGCDQIARDQLSATARQVSALAAAHADNLEQLATIERLLIASAVAGKQALQDGKTDCKTVETSFNRLEQIVLQTPIALTR
jgi:hypothetical protein